MIEALLILLIFNVLGMGISLAYNIQKAAEKIANSNGAVFDRLDEIQGEVKKKGTVTPPFEAANKTHTPGASGSHIIIRKSPDQIRNENFEAIKNGGKYGQAE